MLSLSPDTKSSTVEQTLQQAIALHQAGNLQGAERFYRAILEAVPKHPDANHNMGLLVAVQFNQVAAGLPYFKAALDANPNYPLFWLSYINALILAGRQETARQVLAQGRQRGLQGEAVEALAGQLLSNLPANSRDKQRKPKSKSSKQKTSSNNSSQQENPGVQEINALKSLFNDGRYPETERLARQITERFPRNGLGWKYLGASLIYQGCTLKSLAPMKKAAVLLPGDAEVHSNLGNIFLELGSLDTAEASFKRALKIRPDIAEVHFILGTIFQTLGRLEEAEASCCRATLIKPSYAEAHFNLGNIRHVLGRLSEAEVNYRLALKIKPDFAEAQYNLSNILYELGRLKEAEASYRRALEIKPEYAEAHNNLGNTLKDLGRLDEAEASCRQALEIKPDYSEAYSNLGIVLQESGHLDEAKSSFIRALEIKPGDALTHYELGNLLNDLGKLDAAAVHFRSCLEIDPEDSLGVRLLLARSGLEPIPMRASELHLNKLYVKRSLTWDQEKTYFGHKLVADSLRRVLNKSTKRDILDAGCGTGLVGVLIRDLANRLDGIDMSSAMLEKARAKEIYDHIHLGDLMPFMANNPNSYNAITCAATLIHFGDLSPVFDAAAVSLKDDGLFVFTIFPNDNEQDDKEMVIAVNSELAKGGCYVHSPAYVRRLADVAGFDIESIASEIHEYHNTTPITGLVVALRRRPRLAA